MRALFGRILIVSVMLAGVGCATSPGAAPTAAPTVNVTGRWAGTWSFQNPSLGAGSLSGSFQQDGSRISGTFTIVGGGNAVRNPSAMLVGFVSGNQITLSQPSSGTLTVNGDVISGVVNGLDTATLTLRRQ